MEFTSQRTMQTYNNFGELADNGQFTENAPGVGGVGGSGGGSVADVYKQQSVPPVTVAAPIADDQPLQDTQWGWTKQMAWNKKIENDMKKGFTEVKESIAEVKQLITQR